jgi:uncharacterized protein YxjI
LDNIKGVFYEKGINSGNELTDYTIQIEGKTLRYGDTITLSNAVMERI